ncbi:hypothetical protein OH76DRAFT_538166 [Lentinus brumalis]|uniref:Uncharacterized protein n=1 Tax=Lentinus brumalis TaxID=2498619 RepID=A0A371CHL6_9APHY|nr:hypothetical protein OH76DRAFT_538166 [Polyporus brumalis]
MRACDVYGGLTGRWRTTHLVYHRPCLAQTTRRAGIEGGRKSKRWAGEGDREQRRHGSESPERVRGGLSETSAKRGRGKTRTRASDECECEQRRAEAMTSARRARDRRGLIGRRPSLHCILRPVLSP